MAAAASTEVRRGPKRSDSRPAHLAMISIGSANTVNEIVIVNVDAPSESRYVAHSGSNTPTE